MMTAVQPMTDAQFERLRVVIYQRSGIHFQPTKKYVLESRLSRRLEELEMDDYDQYLMFLTTGPFQSDEFQEMFNRITINETSFFRNEPQLMVFEQRVLPRLLESRAAKRVLRVWSAACSTGEEPYTLAMQIHRTLGLRLSDWRIEIMGTDISEKALTAAQEAIYPEYSLRSVRPTVLQRYFRLNKGSYELDPTIRSMVHFEVLNLKDTFAAQRFGMWDVIFCRNVMIYFDHAMKQRCAVLFHRQLADDGALFIGHSETLRGMDVPLIPSSLAESFAYTRQGGSCRGL